MVVFGALFGAMLGVSATDSATYALAATQAYLTFYAGVFALVALTITVVVGVLASDRAILSIPQRILGQAVHRSTALLGLGFLITHIVCKILAQQARPIDAVLPFVAQTRELFIGFGTIALYLIVAVIATGVLRGRFAGAARPWLWRLLHAGAYLAWPAAVAHGLLSGRRPAGWVMWSYTLCLAAVGVALLVRVAATMRPRHLVGGPYADPGSGYPATGPLPVYPSAAFPTLAAGLALPAGSGMPVAPLPAASGTGPRHHPPGPDTPPHGDHVPAQVIRLHAEAPGDTGPQRRVPPRYAGSPPGGVPVVSPVSPPAGVPVVGPLSPPTGVPVVGPLSPPGGIPAAGPLSPPEGIPLVRPFAGAAQPGPPSPDEGGTAAPPAAVAPPASGPRARARARVRMHPPRRTARRP